MIIIRMSGGLGNQMFQYALYCKLKSIGREVCFDDTSQYDPDAYADSEQKRRPKHLHVFGIEYPVAPKEELIRMTNAQMDVASRIKRKIAGRKSLEIRDEDFVFNPSFLQEPEGYFCGGFQSPRYFEGAEDLVRNAFTFPEDLLAKGEDVSPLEKKIRSKTAAYEKRIREANDGWDQRQADPESFHDAGKEAFQGGSTSIHLRFGDYLDKPDIYGGICTDAYYNEAVHQIRMRDPDMTFFVFSNDREKAGEWVRLQAENKEILGRNRFVLVTGSDEDHGYLDMYLMSLCRNHIIANSSFSWWGAWLCSNPDKIIYAPSIWNNFPDGSELRRTDIYDAGMQRISPAGELITQEPLVSVIVTAYNVAPYIEQAMCSVCEQTYKNLEIIAVDDGSEDDTGTILDAMAQKDARIFVVHRQNGGVAAARNTGLANARGEYVGFVDGDDRAHPLMYETLVRGMLSSGADMGVVQYRERQLGEEEDSSAWNAISVSKVHADEIDRTLDRSVLLNRKRALEAFIHAGMERSPKEVVFHAAVWCKLFRQRVLLNNLFPEGSSAEDIPFTTKALCRSRRVLYIPQVLYDYVQNRSDSIMNTRRARRTLRDEIPAWKEHLAMLGDIGEEDLEKESACYYYRRLLYYEEEYQRCPDTLAEAKELKEIILADKEKILKLLEESHFARPGDRQRLRLYVTSPGLYNGVARLYEKTVVAWKNHSKKG